jgi:WD40 repeat protein
MQRSFSRLTAAALLAFAVSACGGGDGPTPPPATPTASIAIGSAAASIVAGATAPVAVTLTRGGGFTGAVTVTAAALPTGVTASTETIAAGATTATITLTAAASAPTVSAIAGTVTGTGSGVTIAPQALAVTVTSAAGASITLSAASGTVAAGSSGTVTVTLARTGGFTGDVVIGATSLPAGVTVANQTIAAAATTATLTIVATSAAAPATTNISITGTGTGVTITPKPYALTIAAAAITQIGTDILNTDLYFGAAIAFSSDGSRMVVGARGESTSGTTRVFQRSGSTWTQLGQDIVGEGSLDRAGASVDMNAAGTRIAIGAYLNSNGTFSSQGQVRVYDLVGTTWTQVGADIDGEGNSHQFGWRVALSASGNRVVSGSVSAGRARVFDLVGTTWTQVGATLIGVGISGEFGSSVDVSADGSTVAIGAASANGLSRAGTVQLYRLVGGAWVQLGGTITGSEIGDRFGYSVSLSSNGSRVAIGAPSNTQGAAPGSGIPVGQVRVYELNGGTWTQLGASVNGNTTVVNNDQFGEALMLSEDGTRWIGSAAGSSTAQVYTLTSGAWVQTGPNITVAPGVTTSSRSEGVAISPDGKTVAVGFVNGTPRRVRVFSITP